ncbi:hypothetical protein MUK42_33934 [Musa troglodytarum]|uniref:Uncharacterized protein n=1 Tax=Musa troglodytarum TaxID=320322 RepID=A0A9E7FTC7_9LILI|nr:hypothetical protein MUK42_33934 [Musa troglodytarum]
MAVEDMWVEEQSSSLLMERQDKATVLPRSRSAGVHPWVWCGGGRCFGLILCRVDAGKAKCESKRYAKATSARPSNARRHVLQSRPRS